MDIEWRRVHPATLLFEFLEAFRQVVLAVIFLRIGAAGGGEGGLLDFLEFVILGGAFGAAAVRWYTTRYALDAESVRYEYGLLRRRKQAMPRDRIQNVSRTSPFLARQVGVIQLQISDASGGDITMKYLGEAEAERLVGILQPVSLLVPPMPPGSVRESGGAIGGVGSQVIDPQSGVPLVAPSLVRIVQARLAIASTALLSVVPVGLFLLLLMWRADVFSRFDRQMLGLGGLVPLALLLILVAGPLIGILAMGNFRLWAAGDQLTIRSGLLTEQHMAAKRARIQTVAVERTPSLSRLGLERVWFETADLELMGGSVTRFLNPAERLGGWPRLAEVVFGTLGIGEDDLERVSPLTVRRALVRGVALAVLVAIGSTFVDRISAAGVLLVGLGVAWWYAHRRFELLGLAVDDRHLLVRGGVLYQYVTLLDLDKIQKIAMEATWFQRRLGLATVEVIAAGQTGRAVAVIPDLPRNQAASLVGSLTRRSADTPLELTL